MNYEAFRRKVVPFSLGLIFGLIGANVLRTGDSQFYRQETKNLCKESYAEIKEEAENNGKEECWYDFELINQ